MKFIEKEIHDKKGTTRYLFALGKSEAQILQALLQKALLHMPSTIRTMSTERRMQNMSRAMKAAIPQMRKNGPDDYDSPNDA